MLPEKIEKAYASLKYATGDPWGETHVPPGNKAQQELI
jgi:hypothetical protein